jgi:hypothetical protein
VTRRAILTLNCHEAWIYQLRHLDAVVDIVEPVPGRYTPCWDTRMRPFPPNARRRSLAEAVADRHYDCAIAHNISDLLLIEELRCPKLLVLHTSLEHRAAQEGSTVRPADFARAADAYIRSIGAHAAAGTEFKARSWGITSDVLGLAIEPDPLPWNGGVAAGLRVANQITIKRRTLAFSFHESAFHDVPVRLVGHNPDMEGVSPAPDFEALLELYRSHRFFVHTADPSLEDGYNMAAVEAMASGMPVLGNRHPSSPVEDGRSGWLSDDAGELRRRALELIEDRDRAAEMGQAARETVVRMFPPARFVRNLERALDSAQRKFAQRFKRSPWLQPR